MKPKLSTECRVLIETIEGSKTRIAYAYSLIEKYIDDDRERSIKIWDAMGGKLVEFYKKGYTDMYLLSILILDYLLEAEGKKLSVFVSKKLPVRDYPISLDEMEDIVVKGSSISDRKTLEHYVEFSVRTFKLSQDSPYGSLVFSKENIEVLNSLNPDIWKRIQTFKRAGWPIEVGENALPRNT